MAGDDVKPADPAKGNSAPSVFEQLLTDILKNEGAKAHADLAHGFAAFYLVLITDGIETAAAVALTGEWMRAMFEHRRAADTEEAS